jgi:polyhydroxyalkanoate synthesis regulator phasin
VALIRNRWLSKGIQSAGGKGLATNNSPNNQRRKTMLDTLQKGLLTGLGAAVVTREKIMAATRTLVREGKLSKEDAEKLTNDLLEAGRQQWQDIQEKIAASLRGGLETMDIGSHKEIREVQERLENLEKRFTLLEDRLPPVEGEETGGH